MIHIENYLPKSSFLSLKLPDSFWWAISLACGIFLPHYNLQIIIPILCVITYFSKKAYPPALIFLFFTILGCGLYTYHSRSKLPIPVLKNVILEGVITDKSFIDHSFWKHRSRLDVSKIKTEKGWRDSSCVVYIYSKKRMYGWAQDTIQCGPLAIKEPSDKGFALYLHREGVGATSFAINTFSKRIHRPKSSLSSWLFWQRELLQIKLRKKLSRQTFALFSSLFIGNRNPVTNTLAPHKQHFKKWGILHHLARSGLHLVVFIMVWHYLLNIIPLSFVYKHSIISLLVLFYFLFSWSSLSFLRALTVYVLYKIGTLAQTKVHPLHAISSTCLLLLIHNPFHLFFLDFQLSFLLSFCLLWIAHIDHQRNILHHKSLAEKKAKALS
jgi:predicted membrane metal-binding protein